MGSDLEKRSKEILARLKALDNERSNLLQQLANLQKSPQGKSPNISFHGSLAESTPLTSSEQRLALFEKLFCCRTDIFPKLWQNSKTGATGYSPACKNEWAKGVCLKPKVKCSDCPNRSFVPLDESIIRSHLEGNMTIGKYAIRAKVSLILE